MPSPSQFGPGLAKVLGIKLDDPDVDIVTRGESVFSTQTADSFIEQQPTSAEWLAETAPSRRDVVNYFRSLFPFLSWIRFYNLQWFLGDLVAGITIGAVVVPQGMAYAKLANVPVEFGLYSSFMGVLVYWFFATSKDITIGPVAVVSTVTGTVVAKATKELPQYEDTPWVIASALALISGAIVLFIGLIRCGWIVELIPLVSLAAFMTGSALNIAAGQVPTMMGITGFSTRDSTYLVIINTLKNLGKTDLNAAMGLTALAMLYLIRFSCAWLAKTYPSRHKLFFFLSTLRAVFVILLYTMISWLVNMNRRDNPAFAILKDVPRGFQHAAVPTLNTDIVSSFVGELPATVIVLLIEHIAISKSFGRVNNYTINPSQEMVAIGVTNVLAPFLGGYPSTGSFSRTAIKSKAGVRTPFAGVITAAVVLLAIYALTAVFYYIPSASLAAVIIHAVGDLITPPNTLYKFWRISPLEVFIFFVGVFVTVFSTIENGIYATICISFAIFIFRHLKSHGRFLGRVQVHSVLGDHLIGNDNNVMGEYGTFDISDTTLSPPTRNVFLPIDHGDGSNPEVEVSSPYPGVFIYRFAEGFNYPSASHTLDYLTSHIFAYTRRTKTDTYARLGDRPWNDPGPKKGQHENTQLPTLKAIIFDFSSVNNVDVTSVQQLIDVRNQLDRYTTPDIVDFHFACINNRWTKRGLVSAGFGYPTPRPDGLHSRWKSIFSVAEIGGSESAAAAAELEANEKEATNPLRPTLSKPIDDITPEPSAASSITQSAASKSNTTTNKAPEFTRPGEARRVAVHGLNRPLFHVDLTSALQSAIANVRAREEIEAAGGPDIGVTV
ncbi:putative sulfate permease [Hypoxylon trugodes]|uniref:putative sulfate permease n=1 Tax=Hypoxylon trugodes TaxID=326681 RepID=UPI00219A64D5|nr:putative sulfate permease [Hypoxylon trugodes]KAI1390165.1 putative sulfate permease [Hypoxylon trugodes]